MNINTNEISPTIAYYIAMPEPHTHYFEVKMEIKNWTQDSIDLKMPVWTPGSYLVREFARKVEQEQAFNDKKEVLKYQKTNKNTWRIYNKGNNTITFSYRVYSFEHSVRTSFLDVDHAYINASSLFMFIDNKLHLPAQLHIEPFANWNNIATSLKPTSKKNKWTLHIPNYDIFVDSPIEIGTHKTIAFSAKGIPHYLALYGEGNYDTDKMVQDITKIVEAATDVFGENPCEDYTIIQHNTSGARGGLEHLNSTSLMYPRWGFEPENKYISWLGLMSHEYFHLWNVKRVRPKELGPFDYENENYTTLLWVAEGVTSYYDDLLLRRADIIKTDTYLDIVATNITNHENKPGKKVQCLAHASHDAWIKYYRRDENSNNCCVSYYLKGGIVSNMLDLEIMQTTNAQKNLDDVMRYLYNEYYKKQERGFTEIEFKTACNTIAGKDLTDFFDQYIDGTTPIDYNTYFAYVGLKLSNKLASNQDLSLGIKANNSNGQLIVSYVKRDSPAYNDGINVNDELIAINGYRIKSIDDISVLLKQQKEGDTINLLINRDGQLRELKITTAINDKVSYSLEKIDKPTDKQKILYKAWLRTNN